MTYPKKREDRACIDCGLVRSVRCDSKATRCYSCAGKRKPTPNKGKGVKNDPTRLPARNSYYKAQRRVKTNHKGAYSNIEFRFESFEQWFAELGPRPEGHSVDRIDVYGHYEPGNVRWATHAQQCQNRGPRGRHK